MGQGGKANDFGGYTFFDAFPFPIAATHCTSVLLMIASIADGRPMLEMHYFCMPAEDYDRQYRITAMQNEDLID